MANHHELSIFIWQIADLLRGPYRPPQCERVMLPMTVLRRFDCVLAETQPAVLKRHARLKDSKVKNFDPILNDLAKDADGKVNPEDKFALVFTNMHETLFIEPMEQNEEVFARHMNDPAFQKVITTWMSDEVYRRLGSAQVKAVKYKIPRRQKHERKMGK